MSRNIDLYYVGKNRVQVHDLVGLSLEREYNKHLVENNYVSRKVFFETYINNDDGQVLFQLLMKSELYGDKYAPPYACSLLEDIMLFKAGQRVEFQRTIMMFIKGCFSENENDSRIEEYLIRLESRIQALERYQQRFCEVIDRRFNELNSKFS